MALASRPAAARLLIHQPAPETEALCQAALALENFLPEVSVVRPRDRVAYRLRLPAGLRQPAWRLLDETLPAEAEDGRVRYLFLAEIDIANAGTPLPVLRLEDAYRHPLAGEEAAGSRLVVLRAGALDLLRAQLRDDEDALTQALLEIATAAERAATSGEAVSDLAAALGARMLRLPVGPFATVVSLGLTTYVLAWGHPGGGSQSVAAGTLYRLGPDGSATPICTQVPPPLRLLARQTVDDARAACPVARRRGSGPEASQEVTWRQLPPGGGAAGEPLVSAAVAMIEVPALGARAFALWLRREGGARTWPAEESLAIVPLPREAAAGIERRVAEGDRSLLTLAAPQEESDTPIAEPLSFDVEAPPAARGAGGRHLELRLDPDGTLVLVATRRRARVENDPAHESHQIAAYALAATGLPSSPLAWRRICVISWRFEHGPDSAPQVAPRGGSPATRGAGRDAATIPSPPRRSSPGPVTTAPAAPGAR